MIMKINIKTPDYETEVLANEDDIITCTEYEFKYLVGKTANSYYMSLVHKYSGGFVWVEKEEE